MSIQSFQEKYLERLEFLSTHYNEIQQITKERETYMSLLQQRIMIIQALDREISQEDKLKLLNNNLIQKFNEEKNKLKYQLWPWLHASSLIPKEIAIVDEFIPESKFEFPQYISTNEILPISTFNYQDLLKNHKMIFKQTDKQVFNYFDFLIRFKCNLILNSKSLKKLFLPLPFRSMFDKNGELKNIKKLNSFQELNNNSINYNSSHLNQIDFHSTESYIRQIEDFLNNTIAFQDPQLNHFINMNYNKPHLNYFADDIYQSFICIKQQLKNESSWTIISLSFLMSQLSSNSKGNHLVNKFENNIIKLKSNIQNEINKAKKFIRNTLKLNKSINSQFKKELNGNKFNELLFIHYVNILFMEHSYKSKLFETLVINFNRVSSLLLELSDISNILAFLSSYQQIEYLKNKVQDFFSCLFITKEYQQNNNSSLHNSNLIYLNFLNYIITKLKSKFEFYNEWLYCRLPQIMKTLKLLYYKFKNREFEITNNFNEDDLIKYSNILKILIINSLELIIHSIPSQDGLISFKSKILSQELEAKLNNRTLYLQNNFIKNSLHENKRVNFHQQMQSKNQSNLKKSENRVNFNSNIDYSIENLELQNTFKYSIFSYQEIISFFNNIKK